MESPNYIRPILHRSIIIVKEELKFDVTNPTSRVLKSIFFVNRVILVATFGYDLLKFRFQIRKLSDKY